MNTDSDDSAHQSAAEVHQLVVFIEKIIKLDQQVPGHSHTAITFLRPLLTFSRRILLRSSGI